MNPTVWLPLKALDYDMHLLLVSELRCQKQKPESNSFIGSVTG